jgi:ribosomal protein S3
VHFLAQPTLRTNPKTITNYQHADHQLRINRGSANVAVKRGEIGAQIREIEELINAAKQMIGRNVVVKVERVEQAVLVAAVVSHHLSNLP